MDLPGAPGPPRSSKKGLWITIGIHAALFAAAYFIAIPMPAGGPAKTSAPAVVYDDFQMPVKTLVPEVLPEKPATQTVAKSAPYEPTQKFVFTMPELSRDLKWPPFAPIFAPPIPAETPAKVTVRKASKPKVKKARRIKNKS